MKQQAGKTNARSRTSVRRLEGALAGFIVNVRMKRQAEKQTHATELRCGSWSEPRRIHRAFTYETASRKTSARNRTSEWELEGAPAGFSVNLRMKQQAEQKKKSTQPNFGVGVGGSPCRIHCKFTYETASRKNKRAQPNFGEGAGREPLPDSL